MRYSRRYVKRLLLFLGCSLVGLAVCGIWVGRLIFCSCPAVLASPTKGPAPLVFGHDQYSSSPRKNSLVTGSKLVTLSMLTGDITKVELANTSPRGRLAGGPYCHGVVGGRSYMDFIQIAPDDALALRKWKITENTNCPILDTLRLPQSSDSNADIACSPSGRFVAFWLDVGQQREVYLADWTNRRIRRVCVLSFDEEQQQLEVACEDNGTIYIGQPRIHQGPCLFRRYDKDNRASEVGTFAQIFTNRTGIFGLQKQIVHGCIELEVTDLSHPSEPKRHYAFAYAPPFLIPFPLGIGMGLGHVISSEDGQWLGISAGEINRRVTSTFIMWNRAQEQPYTSPLCQDSGSTFFSYVATSFD